MNDDSISLQVQINRIISSKLLDLIDDAFRLHERRNEYEIDRLLEKEIFFLLLLFRVRFKSRGFLARGQGNLAETGSLKSDGLGLTSCHQRDLG